MVDGSTIPISPTQQSVKNETCVLKVGVKMHNRRLTKKERKALKRKRSSPACVVNGNKAISGVNKKICPQKKKHKKTNIQQVKKRKKNQEKQSVPLILTKAASDALESLKVGCGTLSDRLNPSHPNFDICLKDKWKTFSKKERKLIVETDRKAIEDLTARNSSIKHPFTVNPDDHCESPVEAYQDLAPLLTKIATRLGKTPATLKIYDPYFCAGSMKAHLASCGFLSVYNKCEDFYAVTKSGKTPEHDIVVTNPPYSGDHVVKLLEWVKLNEKPFFLLMPNYFCAKPYYEKSLGGKDSTRAMMSYLYPLKRYSYWTPKGMRGTEKVQKHHAGPGGYRTSPFVSFWYVGLFSVWNRQELLKWSRLNANKKVNMCSIESLPRGIRPEELVI